MRVCSIVGMLSCFILLSCHFRDDRVMVVNKDGRELLFAVSLLNPKEREDILSPFRPIKPGEMRTIPLFAKSKLWVYWCGFGIYSTNHTRVRNECSKRTE